MTMAPSNSFWAGLLFYFLFQAKPTQQAITQITRSATAKSKFIDPGSSASLINSLNSLVITSAGGFTTATVTSAGGLIDKS